MQLGKSGFLYGALLALVSVVISSAAAGTVQPSRVWTFELKESGTYKVQISHARGSEPAGTKVSYTIDVGGETQSRDLDLFTDHPFIPLVMSIPAPKTMRVTVSGLSDEGLRKTEVYVYDADSQFPGEYYDPRKGIELKEAQRIRSMLAQPESSIDLAKVKIAVDRMVDPSINAAATQQKIDAIVERIRAMPEYGPTSEAKLATLRRYIYEPGAWNDGRPFRYDLDDPFGKKLSNKLLATYLATKKGNCCRISSLRTARFPELGPT
jgi:hypothetical protein